MALTTATLSGPTSGSCGFESTSFSIDLDGVAPTGGVSVAVVSSVGGDTITSTPVFIPAGGNFGQFTLTPSTAGSRNVSITTTPTLIIAGSPIAYTASANCPDNAGTTNQTKNWGAGAVTCGATFHVGFSVSVNTLAEKDLYCTTGTISLTITE